MVKRNQPEKHIQLQILKYLKLKGYAAGKIKTTGARKGQAFLKDPYHFTGVADLLVFTPKMYFIEVKSPTGRQSPHQIEFQQMCANAGVAYVLARSLDDIISLFP